MVRASGMQTIHMVALEVSSYTDYWDRSYLCLIMLVPMLGDVHWQTPVDNQMPVTIKSMLLDYKEITDLLKIQLDFLKYQK